MKVTSNDKSSFPLWPQLDINSSSVYMNIPLFVNLINNICYGTSSAMLYSPQVEARLCDAGSAGVGAAGRHLRERTGGEAVLHTGLAAAPQVGVRTDFLSIYFDSTCLFSHPIVVL